MDLAKEELSVQTDRIIEQYKLDLNNGPEILAEITSVILGKEKSLTDAIIKLSNFYNPKELQWIGEDGHLGNGVYKYNCLRSTQGDGLYGTVFLHGPDCIIVTVATAIPYYGYNNNKRFTVDVGENEQAMKLKLEGHHKHSKEYNAFLLSLMESEKEKVVKALKEQGFNITNVG